MQLTNYTFKPILLLIGVIVSCRPAQERLVIEGNWEVVHVELNHQPGNAMEYFLANYTSFAACCHYLVDFRSNLTCSGTYIHNDSLIYTTEGRWNLVAFNRIYVKLDRYVDAMLEVDRHSNRYYSLRSDSNRVAALNGAVMPVKIEIRRTDI
ncbi:MAG: hypothetical protein KatS3mg031_0806 [Chitinophagales bacterium]|nr:MAG: hypothetical protein KatS3mg031_0806 [Chitinophagales bacterium]